MSESTNPTPPTLASAPPPDSPARPRIAALRLPGARARALLAALMLTVGVAIGAAIGPAPEPSLAGDAGVIHQLPAVIAAVAAQQRAAATPQATTSVEPPPVTRQATPAAASSPSASTTSTPTPTASTTPAPAPSTSKTEAPAPTTTTKAPAKATLPPITNVWLIELAGGSVAEVLAAPAAAPYIDGQLITKGTLLSGWSALSGSAFATAAALIENEATAGAVSPAAQPSLHSIVQPPCPEGPAGAACAAGTPGQLTAADEFLKGALTSITATPAYGEHGLIVVTFATVGNPSAPELSAGASTSTLASQPPAGVALLSPFALVGARPTTTFNPSSPKQSLEALLH
jgi:hypothetical protein